MVGGGGGLHKGGKIALFFIQAHSGVSVHSADNRGGTEGRRRGRILREVRLLRHVLSCFSHVQFPSIPAFPNGMNGILRAEVFSVIPHLHMATKFMPFVTTWQKLSK